MNIKVAKSILNQLSAQGLEQICLCPGARNAPFVELLDRNDHPFEVMSFFDERSAGFFAFAKARKSKKPVAVITTSGTAVSELLSSVIESFYNHVPLVVISADRPVRLRGTGAPQAIRQNDLLQSYVEKAWDIQDSQPVDLMLPIYGPSHINVCFDEPLIDTVDQSPWQKGEVSKNEWHLSKIPNVSLPKPLVVVSQLTEENRENIRRQLSSLKVPIFLEASSGLRGVESLKSQIIVGGEKLVCQLIKGGQIGSVLRIGDVPLGRYWRDLDRSSIPVYSLSEKNFKGLEKGELFYCNLAQVSLDNLQIEEWDFQVTKEKSLTYEASIFELIKKYPLSEPSFYFSLSEKLGNEDNLYLGNSLPVRLWDLVSQSPLIPQSNRGANGIDGQIASAIGGFEASQVNWTVLGDLTTLYDQNALWQTSLLRDKKIKANLIVVNNQGGQIFDRIFSSSLYRNEHQLSFQKIAEQWGWNYQKIVHLDDFNESSLLNFIEFKPNKEQTKKFWQEYDQLWL